jgi:ABC-type dipeptide/oligopeptide/nickel transport system ATPase subunit
MGRTFEDKPATRESVPLMIGLMGPSGGGKTYSALRLATGIQRVTGGDIFHIDTEARRALHYADRFRFRHLEFGAPFGSLDYLEAIEHCVSKGAKVIIVDSMSHEHEGPGGVLEQHAAETTRLAKKWGTSENAAQMSAWGPCKADRRKMIGRILQLRCNFIFCFRAKEKLKIVKGQDPKPMGYMAIAGEEFVYEMTTNCLLLPGAGGVPTWSSGESGEAAMIKLPEQFRSILLERRGPLDEATGEAMARWAAGSGASAFTRLDAAIRAASNPGELEVVKTQLTEAKKAKSASPSELKALADAYSRRQRELEDGLTGPDGADEPPPAQFDPDMGNSGQEPGVGPDGEPT